MSSKDVSTHVIKGPEAIREMATTDVEEKNEGLVSHHLPAGHREANGAEISGACSSATLKNSSTAARNMPPANATPQGLSNTVDKANIFSELHTFIDISIKNHDYVGRVVLCTSREGFERWDVDDPIKSSHKMQWASSLTHVCLVSEKLIPTQDVVSFVSALLKHAGIGRRYKGVPHLLVLKSSVDEIITLTQRVLLLLEREQYKEALSLITRMHGSSLEEMTKCLDQLIANK